MGIELKRYTNTMVEYFLIIFMIYQSGSIFFIGNHYSITVSVFFIITCFLVFIYLITGKLDPLNFSRVKQMGFILLMGLLMGLTILFNMDYHFNPYLAIFLQLLIAFLCTLVIRLDSFIDKYIKIMLFFSVVSLIFFSLQLIIPNIVYLFPLKEGSGSVNYYDAFIHVFLSAKGYDHLTLLSRNSSIFWEPGAYQAFLNLALFLYLSKSVKLNFWIILIFTLAIFSTFSTNGILIFFLILVAFSKKIFLQNKSTGLLFLFVVFISAVITLERTIIIDSLIHAIAKLNIEGGIVERISLNKIGYLFVDNKINFWGISFSKFETFNEPLWNSILHTTITLGVPFTLILLLGYMNFSRKLTSKWPLLFLIFVMFFSTETLFWRPLFLYLVFVGMVRQDKYTIK